jgi:hypothetical protein
MALIYDMSGTPIDTSDEARAARMRAQGAQPVLGPNGIVGAPPPTRTALPLPPVLPGVVPAPAVAAAQPTEEQAFAAGQQLTRPAGMSEDVPSVPGQTYPLQPLVPRTAMAPGEVGAPAPVQPAREARDALALAGTNQGIAQALAASKPVPSHLQPQVRGQYNMQNTDTAKLPQPVGGGINFGFGVNGAPSAQQVLANYAIQDQRAALVQQERTRLASRAPIESTMAEAVRTKDAIGIRGARAQLAAFDAGHASTVAEQGLNARAEGVTAASKENAATAAAAGTQEAQIRADAALQAANITGQYGVEAAGVRGAGTLATTLAANQSGANRAAASKAALQETQLAAVRAGVEAGELQLQDIIAGTRTGQETAPRRPVDPVTGIPYTDEEIALAQEARLAAARTPRQ